ncbi:MAG: glycosyltransferase family 4 protein [Cytophagaceae bacterium]
MLLNSLLCFVWAFLISVFAIPSIIQVAHIKKLLDEPNKRTVHESLTPRLGGLAIFAGFMSALTIFGSLDNAVQQILAGAIIIFFIGLKDDIVSVSAFKKFFVQVLATGIVMFIGDVRISDFHGIFGIGPIEEGVSYAFTFFVIIGITNAVNLIDGMDGLAGSIACLVAGVFGVFFFLHSYGHYQSYAFVAFSLVGAVFGFLRYNFYKAIIFMGDTGSLVIGFIIAVLAVNFVQMSPTENSPSLAIAILIIPILDTLRVFILRILNGVSPFAPDKNHIHHRLNCLGLSQLQVVFTLILINVLAIVVSLFFIELSSNELLMILIIYGLGITAIIELLYIRKVRQNAQA